MKQEITLLTVPDKRQISEVKEWFFDGYALIMREKIFWLRFFGISFFLFLMTAFLGNLCAAALSVTGIVFLQRLAATILWTATTLLTQIAACRAMAIIACRERPHLNVFLWWKEAREQPIFGHYLLFLVSLELIFSVFHHYFFTESFFIIENNRVVLASAETVLPLFLFYLGARGIVMTFTWAMIPLLSDCSSAQLRTLLTLHWRGTWKNGVNLMLLMLIVLVIMFVLLIFLAIVFSIFNFFSVFIFLFALIWFFPMMLAWSFSASRHIFTTW